MDEESVVLRAKAGDQAAFGQLVEAYGPAMYRLCRAILRSGSDAEDTAQEAFIRAWRELPTLRDVGAWPAWIRRISVNAAVDASRRNRLRSIPLSLASPSPAIDLGSLVATRQELDDAFSRLSGADRAILVLRFYLDLEVPDAASALGIPLGTAKSRLHRALERLRAEMEENR